MIEFSEGPVFFPRRPDQSQAEFLAALAGPQPGLSAAGMAAALESTDALDVVELVAEIEEALKSQPGGC